MEYGYIPGLFLLRCSRIHRFSKRMSEFYRQRSLYPHGVAVDTCVNCTTARGIFNSRPWRRKFLIYLMSAPCGLFFNARDVYFLAVNLSTQGLQYFLFHIFLTYHRCFKCAALSNRLIFNRNLLKKLRN